jgi:hypothetical protein
MKQQLWKEEKEYKEDDDGKGTVITEVLVQTKKW